MGRQEIVEHGTVISLNMFSPMLGEDIEVRIDAVAGLGNVFADRAQLEQVLMNLVVNARDAMPTGGRLDIDLSNVDVCEGSQPGERVPSGKYVLISVTDTGSGMDAATQERIFEPFFTTKPVGKGTGLGLSTVYGIVKQSEGFILVDSAPGRGTSFKVYLPRVEAEAEAVVTSKDGRSEAMGHGETVLLVDDEADLRAAAREFLEAMGYRVLEAGNGLRALEVCAVQQALVEVLVTDMIMPGMRGSELAAKMAKLYPGIKTVYMSGYTDRSQDIDDLGHDAVFLRKPVSLNGLAKAVHSVLHNENHVGRSR